jgi:hypothetical protein
VASTASATVTLRAGEVTSASQDRTLGFLAAMSVDVWAPNLATKRGTVLISSVTATELVLASLPAGTVADDVIIPSPYADQPAPVRALYAFLAGADGIPKTVGYDAAHEYTT